MVDTYISIMERLPKELKKIVNEYSNNKLEYWRETIREIYIKYQKTLFYLPKYWGEMSFKHKKQRTYYSFDFDDDDIIKSLIIYKNYIPKLIIPTETILECIDEYDIDILDGKLNRRLYKKYDYLINGKEYVIFAMLLNGYKPTVYSNMAECNFKAKWFNTEDIEEEDEDDDEDEEDYEEDEDENEEEEDERRRERRERMRIRRRRINN